MHMFLKSTAFAAAVAASALVLPASQASAFEIVVKSVATAKPQATRISPKAYRNKQTRGRSAHQSGRRTQWR